jgi:hypothetical protein
MTKGRGDLKGSVLGEEEDVRASVPAPAEEEHQRPLFLAPGIVGLGQVEQIALAVSIKARVLVLLGVESHLGEVARVVLIDIEIPIPSEHEGTAHRAALLEPALEGPALLVVLEVIGPYSARALARIGAPFYRRAFAFNYVEVDLLH